MIFEGIRLADVVKLSGEELEFLSSADLRTGAELLYEKYKMKLLAVTLGPRGCVCRMKQGFFTSEAFDVSCVDTTGAGDAFWGAVLAGIVRKSILLEDDSPDQINALLDAANAAGALATTKKGAIPAMPDEKQIHNCIGTMPRANRGRRGTTLSKGGDGGTS